MHVAGEKDKTVPSFYERRVRANMMVIYNFGTFCSNYSKLECITAINSFELHVESDNQHGILGERRVK